MLKSGITGNLSVIVDKTNCATTIGSGTLEVFATPSMIALMEQTAWQSVAPYLNEGDTTVGTKLDISHCSPTPQGSTVTCKSVLTLVDGRRLVFDITASDNAGLIGKGRHERFIVHAEEFQAKAEKKGVTSEK